MSEHDMDEHDMSKHNKKTLNSEETFYVCNSKYVAKIEWNKESNPSEDNLYVGTLVSELRNYGNLAPIRDSIYFHGRDYNEVIEMFYQACNNYEGIKYGYHSK